MGVLLVYWECPVEDSSAAAGFDSVFQTLVTSITNLLAFFAFVWFFCMLSTGRDDGLLLSLASLCPLARSVVQISRASGFAASQRVLHRLGL